MTEKTDRAFALTSAEDTTSAKAEVAPAQEQYREYILGFLRRQKERMRSVDKKIADHESRILLLEAYENTSDEAYDPDAPKGLTTGDKNANCTQCVYLGELGRNTSTCFKHSPALDIPSPSATWCNDFGRRNYYARKESVQESKKVAPYYNTVRGYDFSDKGAKRDEA